MILYFLGTDDLRINYERVNNRIKEGGHSVAETIIIHRYKIGLSYLKSKILLFQHFFLIDNSAAFPIKMAEIKSEELIFKESGCPSWVNEVLEIVELLQKKKKQN